MNQVIEDYLKNIYVISQQHKIVSTNALAARLDISAASVSVMIKKLAEMKYVNYEPYRGVELTASGLKTALEVIRHHRLVEVFLAETLKIPWDKVHEEAERLEHVISDYVENKIDEHLGFPKVDPHGAPIPLKDGFVPEDNSVQLSRLETGQVARVFSVDDNDPEFLRYLAGMNLFPGTIVEILNIAPFDGPITILVNGSSHIIGHKAAGEVFVEYIEDRKEKMS